MRRVQWLRNSVNVRKVKLICSSTRGLTLPSRGRPTSGFASCRPPLMSNVRPHQMRRQQRRSAALHERAGLFIPRRPSDRSLPATKAGFPKGLGLPFVGARSVELGRGNSTSVVSSKSSTRQSSTVHKAMNVKRINRTMRGNSKLLVSALQRCASSSALRSTAAPGPHVGSGASYRSRRAVSCRVAAREMLSSSTMRPNPSIEGTCNIRLRRLSPAPHVKR
jgi:hypothetical protein